MLNRGKRTPMKISKYIYMWNSSHLKSNWRLTQKDFCTTKAVRRSTENQVGKGRKSVMIWLRTWKWTWRKRRFSQWVEDPPVVVRFEPDIGCGTSPGTNRGKMSPWWVGGPRDQTGSLWKFGLGSGGVHMLLARAEKADWVTAWVAGSISINHSSGFLPSEHSNSAWEAQIQDTEEAQALKVSEFWTEAPAALT